MSLMNEPGELLGLLATATSQEKKERKIDNNNGIGGVDILES